jgi:hypothetical protein
MRFFSVLLGGSRGKRRAGNLAQATPRHPARVRDTVCSCTPRSTTKRSVQYTYSHSIIFDQKGTKQAKLHPLRRVDQLRWPPFFSKSWPYVCFCMKRILLRRIKSTTIICLSVVFIRPGRGWPSSSELRGPPAARLHHNHNHRNHHHQHTLWHCCVRFVCALPVCTLLSQYLQLQYNF